VENPVTLALKFLCMRELSNIRDVTADKCLCRCDPQRTQEQLVEQVAREFEWAVFLELLLGDWENQLGDLDNFSKLVEVEDEDE